jgi:hypothetical protein
MNAQRLSDCTDCRSAGSVSNGYCMICGAPELSLHAGIRPGSLSTPRPTRAATMAAAPRPLASAAAWRMPA